MNQTDWMETAIEVSSGQQLEVFAFDDTPGDVGRAGTATAVCTMAVNETKRLLCQGISHSAAQATTGEIHTKIIAPVFAEGKERKEFRRVGLPTLYTFVSLKLLIH